jgi:hypothetical protein
VFDNLSFRRKKSNINCVTPTAWMGKALGGSRRFKLYLFETPKDDCSRLLLTALRGDRDVSEVVPKPIVPEPAGGDGF